MTRTSLAPVRHGLILTAVAFVLAQFAGCAQVKSKPVLPEIQNELRQATQTRTTQPLPPAVAAALAPRLDLPKPAATPLEPRFDLAVNAAPAQQVFMGIASGTRYSMLLHPEVAGTLTVNLKDVTVPEALSAIRELYGYDYRIDGARIFVQPLTAQTRFYAIDYPIALRRGTSELRVISGSIADSGGKSGGASGSSGGSSGSQQVDSSRVVTQLASDFWNEVLTSTALLIGCTPASGAAPACPAGRNVVASPHSGMLAVRAPAAEHRQVDAYLKAAKLSVQRQVMIEAKILEVTLNEGAQSGVNWAYFQNGAARWGKGIEPGSIGVPGGAVSSTAGALLGTGLPVTSAASTSSAGLFGLSFQTASFAALINFLETQGGVQVLSSPRIAALNNQKAVLKVGTDEFFVTEVTTSTSTTGSTTTAAPTVTTQPFFSGIALDVTPQIDDAGNIILHVHPSVSVVTSTNKDIDLGTLGRFTLPLATSTVSETDSVVRLKDGEIAAIGGLMKRASSDTGSGVPGLADVPGVGAFFKNSNASRQKQELVILLKPTLIDQPADWLEGVREVETRLREFAPAKP